MKFDANNKKNPDYNEEHVIYAGATTGGLKSKKYFKIVTLFCLFL
jgi:hypothetical protein